MNDKLNFYSEKEEKLNVLSHGLGLILSIVALVLLIIDASLHGTSIHIVSFSIYGGSLVLLYSASTFYHYVQKPKLRYRLNILDHAAIYVLIAGTYTPFALLVLKNWIGWTIFGISWGIALVGIIFKLFFTGKYDKISTISYVLMGWLIVFVIKPMLENFETNGLYWLLAGGIFYTVGAVLYSIKKIPFNHAIFHIFVLLGSFSHFVAVFWYILP